MSAGVAPALDLSSGSAGETPAGRRRYFSAALVALLSQATDLFYVVQAVD